MHHNKEPYNYDPSSKEHIQDLSVSISALIEQGATDDEVMYLYGEDVPGYVQSRILQKSPNARTITTFARKIADEPYFQYLALSKTLEQGQPDEYKIYFLDNAKKDHAIVEFNSNSTELVLRKTSNPNEVEYVRGSTLSTYSSYFSRDKLRAIRPDNSIELSTCSILMKSVV
jgi:hypothetical protein